MSDNQRFTIDEVAEDGEPIAPAKHANIFRRQCGVIVRDNVLITIQEWHQPKKEGSEEVSYVDNQTKDLLWDLLMVNFTLPPEEDPEKNSIE